MVAESPYVPSREELIALNQAQAVQIAQAYVSGCGTRAEARLIRCFDARSVLMLAASAHGQNPALRRDCPDLFMSLDKGVSRGDSLAK